MKKAEGRKVYGWVLVLELRLLLCGWSSASCRASWGTIISHSVMFPLEAFLQNAPPPPVAPHMP